MPSPHKRPLFTLRVPLRWWLVVLALVGAVAYWMVVEGDMGVRIAGVLFLLFFGPLAVYNGFLIHHTVTDKGMTEWRWRGPGRGHAAIASFEWTDIRAVWLYDPNSFGAVQYRIEGEAGGRPHTMYVPSFAGPTADALRHLIEQAGPELDVSDSVADRLARRAAV